MLKTILLKHKLYLLPQIICLEDEIVVSQFLYRRIQKASVFSQLTLSPYIRTKVSKSDREMEKDDSDTSIIKFVLSAYWEILVTVSRNLNPLISLLFLTALPRSTSQRRDMKMDMLALLPYSRGKNHTPICCFQHSCWCCCGRAYSKPLIKELPKIK